MRGDRALQHRINVFDETVLRIEIGEEDDFPGADAVNLSFAGLQLVRQFARKLAADLQPLGAEFRKRA